MKRWVLVLALLAVAACTSESNFPVATGKGTVRTINAMHGSPATTFLIEERVIGQADFQDATAATRWDNLAYIFNWEASFLGELQQRRVASFPQKIDADGDYTFVLTGDITAPDVTVWEGSEREWNGNETVSEFRFSNVAEIDSRLGPIDVYFAPDGTAPVAGEEIATLAFGEITPAMDTEASDYVLTLTRAGDPLDILYQSIPVTFVLRTAFIISVFDVDAQDTANLSVVTFNTLGPTIRLADANAEPTIRFVQTSIDLPNSDVYDDDMQTNLILSDHAFGDITDDMPIATGLTTHYYTPVGDTSATLFEGDITTVLNSRWNWLVVGQTGERNSHSYVPLRRTISIYTQLTMFHAAFNNQALDFYVVDADVPIDDEFPQLFNVSYTLPIPTLTFEAGSYDMYATLQGEKTIIGGPVRIDVVDGDIVEVILFDMVDPALVDIRILPTQ